MPVAPYQTEALSAPYQPPVVPPPEEVLPPPPDYEEPYPGAAADAGTPAPAANDPVTAPGSIREQAAPAPTAAPTYTVEGQAVEQAAPTTSPPPAPVRAAPTYTVEGQPAPSQEPVPTLEQAGQNLLSAAGGVKDAVTSGDIAQIPAAVGNVKDELGGAVQAMGGDVFPWRRMATNEIVEAANTVRPGQPGASLGDQFLDVNPLANYARSEEGQRAYNEGFTDPGSGTTFQPGPQAVWEQWVNTKPWYERAMLDLAYDPTTATAILPALEGASKAGKLPAIVGKAARATDVAASLGTGPLIEGALGTAGAGLKKIGLLAPTKTQAAKTASEAAAESGLILGQARRAEGQLDEVALTEPAPGFVTLQHPSGLVPSVTYKTDGRIIQGVADDPTNLAQIRPLTQVDHANLLNLASRVSPDDQLKLVNTLGLRSVNLPDATIARPYNQLLQRSLPSTPGTPLRGTIPTPGSGPDLIALRGALRGAVSAGDANTTRELVLAAGRSGLLPPTTPPTARGVSAAIGAVESARRGAPLIDPATITAVEGVLRRRLDQQGLSDVGIALDKVIQNVVSGTSLPNVEGQYFNRVINLATDLTDTADPAELALKLGDVMNHEVVHATRHFGLYRDTEWRSLERMTEVSRAAGDTMSFLDEVTARYTDAANKGAIPSLPSPDQLREEAVAEMYRAYAAGGLTQMTKVQTNLLDKLTHFFHAVVETLRGARGDAVLRRIESGEVGGRARGATPTMSAPLPALVRKDPALTLRPQGKLPEPLPVGVPANVEGPNPRYFMENLAGLMGKPGPGAGGVTDDMLTEAFDRIDAKYGMGLTRLMTKGGALETLRLPTAEDWNRALSQDWRELLWYEDSARSFVSHTQLPPGETNMFYNMLSATSQNTQPKENLDRTISAMAETMQGLPVLTPTTSPNAVREAKSALYMSTPKYFNFSNTPKYLTGMIDTPPGPTLDLQFSQALGLEDNAAMSGDVYNAFSEYLVQVRTLINRGLGEATPAPLQTWNLQAALWVDYRTRAGVDTIGSAYSHYLDDVVRRLDDIGAPLSPDGKIIPETFMHPDVIREFGQTAEAVRQAGAGVAHIASPQPVSEARRLNALLRQTGTNKTAMGEYATKVANPFINDLRTNVMPNMMRAITGAKFEGRALKTASRYADPAGGVADVVEFPLYGLAGKRRQDVTLTGGRYAAASFARNFGLDRVDVVAYRHPDTFIEGTPEQSLTHTFFLPDHTQEITDDFMRQATAAFDHPVRAVNVPTGGFQITLETPPGQQFDPALAEAGIHRLFPGDTPVEMREVVRQVETVTAADYPRERRLLENGINQEAASGTKAGAERAASRTRALVASDTAATNLRRQWESNATTWVASRGAKTTGFDTAADAARAEAAAARLATKQAGKNLTAAKQSVAKGQSGITPMRPGAPAIPGIYDRGGVEEYLGTLVSDTDKRVLDIEFSFGGRTEKTWQTLVRHQDQIESARRSAQKSVAGAVLSSPERQQLDRVIADLGRAPELRGLTERDLAGWTDEAVDRTASRKTAQFLDQAQGLRDQFGKEIAPGYYKGLLGRGLKAYDNFAGFRRTMALYSTTRGPAYVLMQAIGNALTLAIAKPSALGYYTPMQWNELRKVARVAGEPRLGGALAGPAPYVMRLREETGLGASGRLLGSRDQLNSSRTFFAQGEGARSKIGRIIAPQWVKNWADGWDQNLRGAVWRSVFEPGYASLKQQLPERMGRALADAGARSGFPARVGRAEFEAAVNGLPPRFSGSDLRKALYETAGDDAVAKNAAERIARDYTNNVRQLDSRALDEVDRIGFSFDETRADAVLNRLVMFHYWLSRASVLYLREAARNPWQMQLWARAMNESNRQLETGVPSWQKDMMEFMQTPAGVTGLFSPAYLLGTYLFFQEAGEPSPLDDLTQVGGMIEKSFVKNLMLNPLIQGAIYVTGMGGPDFKPPDILGTGKWTNDLNVWLDKANKDVTAFYAENGAPKQIPNIDSRALISWVAEQITTRGWENDFFGMAPIQGYDPNASEQANLAWTVRDAILRDHPELGDGSSASAEKLGSLVEEALSTPGSDYYQQGYQTLVDSTMAGPGSGRDNAFLDVGAYFGRLFLPFGINTQITSRREKQIRSNLETGTEADKQMGYVDDATPAKRDFDLGLDQVNGSWSEGANAVRNIYNGVKGGTLPEGMESITIDGVTWTSDTLTALPSADRATLAQYWMTFPHPELGGKTGWEIQDEAYDAQNAAMAEHPDVADYRALDDYAKSYPGGPIQFIQDTAAVNANYRRYVEQLPTDFTEADFVKEATSVNAWGALSGTKLSTYDPTPMGAGKGVVAGLPAGTSLGEWAVEQREGGATEGNADRDAQLDAELANWTRVDQYLNSVDPSGDMANRYANNLSKGYRSLDDDIYYSLTSAGFSDDEMNPRVLNEKTGKTSNQVGWYLKWALENGVQPGTQVEEYRAWNSQQYLGKKVIDINSGIYSEPSEEDLQATQSVAAASTPSTTEAVGNILPPKPAQFWQPIGNALGAVGTAAANMMEGHGAVFGAGASMIGNSEEVSKPAETSTMAAATAPGYYDVVPANDGMGVQTTIASDRTWMEDMMGGHAAVTTEFKGPEPANCIGCYGYQDGHGAATNNHAAYDISCDTGDCWGTPISSPITGKVLCSGYGAGTGESMAGCEYSRYMTRPNPDGTPAAYDVVLDAGVDAAGNPLQLSFSHVGTSSLQPGQLVNAGDPLLTMGDTDGGPHIHLEVWGYSPTLGTYALLDPQLLMGGYYQSHTVDNEEIITTAPPQQGGSIGGALGGMVQGAGDAIGGNLGGTAPAPAAPAPAPSPAPVATGGAGPRTSPGLTPGDPTAYQPLVDQAAQENGVPPQILSALLQQESQYDPYALSPAGAQGIAQFMPETAAGYGIDPYDPNQAIPAAAQFLASNYAMFGDWALAVAAYNAGPGAVQQYGGIPPFPETQNYVDVVMGSV